jgi:FeS assembly SUF system protein
MAIMNILHNLIGKAPGDDLSASAEAHQSAPDDNLEERIVTAMRGVYDPEISLNIYDLGLIYNIDINAEREVVIDMTLTAPACPVAGILPGQVEAAVKRVEGVKDAHVRLVWDPPWSRERISDEGKLAMGLF